MDTATALPRSTNSPCSVRKTGHLCMVGGTIAAVGAVVTTLMPSSVPATQVSYPFTATGFILTEPIWTLAHILMFLGTLGLARSGAAGTSRLGRIGLRIALVAMALIAAFEFGYVFFPNAVTDSMPDVVLNTGLGLSSTFAAIGYVFAGIAVLRARRWQGWRRFIPLLCGLWVFVVLLPALVIEAATGITDLFLLPVAGWSACFVVLGLALATSEPLDATIQRA